MVLKPEWLRSSGVGNASLGESAGRVEVHVPLNDLSVQRDLNEDGIFDLFGGELVSQTEDLNSISYVFQTRYW